MMDKNNTQNNLKLQQTVRFFETLLRASADGIVITDPAKNIIFVNDTFCKFFSSNRHEVIETNLFVWLAKLDHNAKDIWKGLETQINEHGIAKDVEFASKTGEGMRYFSVNSSLLEKIDIEEAGLIISIWRDDTERKMVDMALKQAHDELEMRVKERTAQLTNTNIELISEITERERVENILLIQKDIASSISVSGDIEIMFDQILKAVSHIEGIDSGGVYISDRLTGDLILRAHYGFSPEFVEAVAHYTPDTVHWQLVKEGKPVYLTDSSDVIKMGAQTEGLRGVALIPVMQQESVIGSLNMASHTLNEIPINTRMILETIAGQLREVFAYIGAEEKLIETKNYLDTVIKSSYDSIFVIDEEGRFEFGNEAFFKIMGYPEREIVGHTFMKLIHPDYHDFILKRWDEVKKAEGKPYEVDIVRKDGTVRSLSVSHTNMELSGKRKYCVIAKDITERKQAEKDLKEAIIKAKNEKNKSESIIAALGDAISIQDTDFKVLYQNKIHQEIVGDQKGRYCYREYEHRDNICDGCPVNRSFKDGKIHNEERSIIKDGQRLYFDIKSSPLRDSTGKIIAGIEIARDITERKHAEKDRMQLLAREHEARVEVEAARKLDSMKSMFLASTSHELRTPLNSIIGFTSLILDGVSGELNPEQKEQLEIVHSSGKHLLALINDIIDLSQMEAGRKNVEVSEFNLGEVVEEAFSILNIILKEKKLELKVDVGDILMKSDRRRLLQCLMNLLGNAIKYTEKGSVEITAKVIDNNVEISVIDTGIGMKTEDIPKLFGPFVRLQSKLTLKTSGTGLGLYLVKKLATDFLGGDVDVKSEYGKGSTFTLHVPVELEGSRKAIYSRPDFTD